MQPNGFCGGELVERATVERRGLFPSLRYPDFRALFTTNFISYIGTWVHNVVLLLWVQNTYGTPGSLGLVNFMAYLPVIIFFLVAGTLTDVVDRRKLLIYSQSLMAAAAFALAVEVITGAANLLTVCITVFILGIGYAVSFPAFFAITFDLVEPRHILNAISLNAASFNTARFVGPLLASLLVAQWSFSGGFLANSLSFLPVIVALLIIKTPASERDEGGRIFNPSALTEGIRYAWHNAWARNLLLTLGAMNLFTLPFIVFLPTYGEEIIRAGDAGVFALYAASGFGAVLGVPVLNFLNRRWEEREIIKINSLVLPLALIAFSFSSQLWLSMILLCVAGIASLLVFSSINSLLQLKVEPRLRGRILSIFYLMLTGLAPLGGIILGFLADRWGITSVLAPSFFLFLICGVALTVFPRILREATTPLARTLDASRECA